MLKVIPWPWLSFSKRYESDLLNEVLYILVGQEAAKISEVKVGGKKNLPDQPGPRHISLEPGSFDNFSST